VQDEREPLGRVEGLEDHEQGKADRIGQERLLLGVEHGVIGLAHRAEHPVGHRAQAGSVGLEAVRQPVALTHRSHPFAAFRHRGDGPNAPNVTKEIS
jgi:hypothetical protein